MKNISGKWEDSIFAAKNFIQELSKVQDERFDKIFQELQEEGFSDQFDSEDEAKDYLFDYIYNEDDKTKDFYDYLTIYSKRELR
tara:strand:- start:7862 stop:8113 length:252 start_codon:yes stop_codon:yes gene_type:complete